MAFTKKRNSKSRKWTDEEDTKENTPRRSLDETQQIVWRSTTALNNPRRMRENYTTTIATTMDRNLHPMNEWTSQSPDNDTWITEIHKTTTIGSQAKIFLNSSIINTSLSKNKTFLRRGIFSRLTNSTTTKVINMIDA